jgi:hypothetical protein
VHFKAEKGFIPSSQNPICILDRVRTRILSGSETATMAETNLTVKAALQCGKGEAPAELHAKPVNHCIGLSCSDNSVKQILTRKECDFNNFMPPSMLMWSLWKSLTKFLHSHTKQCYGSGSGTLKD